MTDHIAARGEAIKRGDHVEAARQSIAFSDEAKSPDAIGWAIQEANVHATLAVAEQLRIANLLMLRHTGALTAQGIDDPIFTPDQGVGFDVKIELLPDVAAALGLTPKEK